MDGVDEIQNLLAITTLIKTVQNNIDIVKGKDQVSKGSKKTLLINHFRAVGLIVVKFKQRKWYSVTLS